MDSLLIIDDDDDTNLYTTYIVRHSGLVARVDVAHDGEEALSFLKIHPPPSLILLDINMPRMNGWQFLTKYRKEIPLCSPIVMLTISIDPDDKKKAKEHSVHFLRKPLTEESFRLILTEVSL